MDRGYIEACAVSCVEFGVGNTGVRAKNPLYIKMDTERKSAKEYVLMIEVTWIGDDGQVHMRREPCDKVRILMKTPDE